MMKIHSSTNRMKPRSQAVTEKMVNAVGSMFTREGYRLAEDREVR